MKLFGEPVSGDRRAELTKVKPCFQRRLSAPSLILSKALTRTKASTASSECVSDVSPASCDLVQALLGPRRKLVCHGVARLQAGLQTQERYLFLFSDIFIIGKAKSCSQVKQKACVRVCEMWTASCLDEVCESTTSPDTSFVIGWPTYNCVATFSTASQKERWFSLLESCIQEEKEHDDPKVIPLKIYVKDAGNCAYAKALSVRNTDCTSDVINAALQQFGLPGTVKDFQLWVSSSKDEAPYPLIGHEFPYSIKMNHILALQQDGEMLPHHQVALLSDDTRCQFILRPCRVNCNRTVSDEPRIKRKVPLFTWPFRRSSTTDLDSHLQSSTSPDFTAGCLFGQPLSDVIVDNTLPPPIKDMLLCLSIEGAATCGIFRRSAGVKACRELRMKLDSGTYHHCLNEESVFVTAAVFKEFLRNIPASLLCEDLYDQWLRAVECNAERGNESSVQEVQRLIQLLPKEHCLLLKHVIAMLHYVQSHADHNQMNSSNLAVCIAPSLLWSNSSLTLQEDTKKVCDLVRFLIDNCHSVFGEDITSLIDLSLDSRRNCRSAGSLRHFSDSCYDSLENELNAEPEDLPSIRLNMLSQDSLISLSDCDLDQSELDVEPDSSLPLARIKTFTPTVRQLRPQKLRRCSEPALVGHAPLSLEVRKASLDSSAMQEEMRVEDGKDNVFLEHGLRNLKLTCRGGRVSQHGRQNLRLSNTGSSLSSSASSSSSVSSMEISSDSVFSQSDEHCGALGPQGSSLKFQSEVPLQKNHNCLHPVTLTEGYPSQEPGSFQIHGGSCVKHLSCRASKPPSYQEALLYLNRSPPAQMLKNSPLPQTSSMQLFHEEKSLFYRGPAPCPIVEPQSPSNRPTLSTSCSEAHPRSDKAIANLDPWADNEVFLPQSVFFGQSCRLTLQRSRLLSQDTVPTLPGPLSGRSKGLGSHHSTRQNAQNSFIKPASNGLGVVRGLEDLDQCSGGLYCGQWGEDLEHGLQPEESYV
ncbi:rho GTPase-activating protein 20 isoform X1 [Pygocentrus nattereri]|uniref:rho GTPase-activating protein 20 isoform X1 n=1 Tax=Pygocentrus nattereri TaxID=42514 RepID=UPI0008149801|nr:rho GTPase-activating protein 20 isoform X1 [Pygocentrus nattereri]